MQYLPRVLSLSILMQERKPWERGGGFPVKGRHQRYDQSEALSRSGKWRGSDTSKVWNVRRHHSSAADAKCELFAQANTKENVRNGSVA